MSLVLSLLLNVAVALSACAFGVLSFTDKGIERQTDFLTGAILLAALVIQNAIRDHKEA